MIARLLPPARLLLGAMLLYNGLNHFAGPFMPFPEGSTPLAIQLMEALRFSALLDVAMGMQMAAGVAILVNRFAPLALAAVMPVNICGLYWALLLERSPTWSLCAGLAVALTALLMFALLHRYAAMLEPHPLALGESAEHRYETLYARSAGQTGGRDFALALLPLVAAAAFYHFLVPSVLGLWCLVVLMIPLAVLILRALQRMLVNPERQR
ncbi:hypothetical protein [Alteraurantiacibacter palmitatis]|uniref:DoxX family membrane protein n=1 Tax=Alteraurantiacibacter palmitatis TaxID=2054628 RepID=A0ABV7E850_9SPHN